jgi:urease accessory protein UreF
MLNQRPTDTTKRRLALTLEIAAATTLGALAIALGIQQETALAVVLAVGCASFLADAARRVRRTSRN